MGMWNLNSIYGEKGDESVTITDKRENRTMENQIFREKSVERISSPEELNKYLRVTNPGVWAILCAVIAFLAGLIVWASVGTLETKAEAVAEANNGIITVVVTGDRASLVQEGMTVEIEDDTTVLSSVHMDEYGRAIGEAVLNVPDGKYRADVVVESITPISFLIRNEK